MLTAAELVVGREAGNKPSSRMIRLQVVENKTLPPAFCPAPQSALTVLYVDITMSYVAMLSALVSFSFP